tara:strand:- start:311 stop:712 length:402 start_codon:yes stop_codon:yes gene_type:complete
MAIQQIKTKRIIKHDVSNPNFKADPIKIKPEPVINGNSIENNDKGVYQGKTEVVNNVYGEDMKNMMTQMLGKIDNIRVKNGNINIYDESIEVDIKRNVFLSKADDSKVKIDNVKKGKVNNKVNKLRALRRNGN